MSVGTIWVLAEAAEGGVASITNEMLAKARQLSDDVVAELASLGQHFVRDRGNATFGGLSKYPNGSNRHVQPPQMTLSSSRNETMRSYASPSSSIISPASRAGASSTATIS